VRLSLDNTAVFNPLDIKLDKFELCIIGLGLKFLPFYSDSILNIRKSIYSSIVKYSRLLKLRLYFTDSTTNYPIIPLIDNNNFIPSDDKGDNYLQMIDRYVSSMNHAVSKLQCKSCLSTSDKFILKIVDSIKRRSDLVIKPADKNLGTVILSPEFYNELCMKHLLDTSTYHPINTLNFNELAYERLINILKHHNQLYSPYQKDRAGNNILSKLSISLLQLKDSSKLRRAASFYILPKVHKKPLLGRPIVSCINSLTLHASRYIDKLLQPLMHKLPSICTSSQSVIKELSDKRFPINSVILCADVKSLYPSIPTEYGLNAVRCVLSDRLYEFESSDIDFIIDLLAWVLNNNFIEYNNTVYHQISGTAMGTPAAVVYANIVLFHLERDCLFLQPHFYTRFIDDLCVICTGVSQANTIVETFNRQCPGIKLDAITIKTSGVFLDINLSIQVDGSIQFQLYQKPDNKYLYIPPTSAHDKRLLKNIIVQEIRRYRICNSCDVDFILSILNFKQRLLNRGYDLSYLNPIFYKLPDRDILLSQLISSKLSNKHNKTPTNPILVLELPKLNSAGFNFRSLFKIPIELSQHPRFVKAFGPDGHIVVGRRNGLPLGRMLCHAR